jgi:alpha-amylase
MVSVCFYFQVHQPFRLGKYSVFDINKNHNYFDNKKNKEVMLKVAKKCYLPMNNLLLNLIKKFNGKFKISFSISGTALEQFELYAPEVLESFKELAKTGCVDFLCETYYHSLSFIYSNKEFEKQVFKHKNKIKKLFNITPKVFRNTELIYNDELAKKVSKLGFEGVLAEGADKILDWRSPNFVYSPPKSKIKLLLKNYKLSDDIAFRFSNKGWKEHPLTIEKYVKWINNINGNGEIVNLFMDYETFGEHQWKDTGIFEFMKKLPEKFLEHPDNDFVSINEAVKKKSYAEISFPYFVSWADTERDLTAWNGNDVQKSALKELYELEEFVKTSKNKKIICDWEKLTTSDHFYYMCTKWFNDGDVHKYFSPYDSPYDCFMSFMNVLNDLALRIKEANIKEKVKNVENKKDFVPLNNPVKLIKKGEYIGKEKNQN